MAFIHYRTKGFIFKKTARFEADILFTIFTYDFVKIEVVGRAIRKITSKLRAGAELFYLSEIEFIQGKSYKTLTDSVVLEKFIGIREDIEKLKIAYQIAEVLDNLIKGEQKDGEIFDLLNELFIKLNTYQLTNLPTYQLFYYYFLWNLLSILGYQPELFKCVICQNPVDLYNRVYFSVKEGGVICSACAKSKKEVEEIDSDTVKILRIILPRTFSEKKVRGLKGDWQTVSKLKIGNTSQKLLKNITENYYFNLLRG